MINVRKIFGTTKKESTINWKPLISEETLQNAIDESTEQAVLIFKHSTRCSISSMALSRLESDWDAEEVNNISPYYLDLIAFRNISNLVADTFDVMHESPQALVIKNGKCTFDTSHMGISFHAIKQQIS